MVDDKKEDKAATEYEYKETQPGQEEIVAGSAEHERLLKAYPNATSYSSDVNIVPPPEPVDPEEGGGEVGEKPVNVDVPYVSQTDNLLDCTMGNWTGEPTSYDYAWKRDGVEIESGDIPSYELTEEDAGTTIVCAVSATNAAGTSTAPDSNGIDVSDAGV